MTIYYLCVKTHKNTGLKYLCQTTQDPYSYYGSGVDWKRHLLDHGRKHKTDILVECNSREELSFWGRYYSDIFRVVTAMDDFGNKIWANRIPETGSGAGRKAGFSHSSHTRQLIGRNASGRSIPADVKLNISNSLKGREPWNKGQDWTDVYSQDERSKKFGKKGAANPMFGKPVPTKVCPHCRKTVDIRNYARYHGDKCKLV